MGGGTGAGQATQKGGYPGMAWRWPRTGVDVGTTGVRWATYVPQTGRVEPNRQGGGGVVAALPADQAVFRLVEMPPLPARERKDALRWELQRILPLPVDEAVYDWVELPTVDGEASREPGGGAAVRAGGPGAAEPVRFAVSGAAVAAVDQRLDALRRRRIRPAVLEPEWVTLWRCAWWLGCARAEPAPVAVIDFGATSTRLAVVDPRGNPVAFHRSPVGGLALEEDLVRTLGELPSAVRRLLASDGALGLEDLQRSQAVASLLGDLARTLRRARAELGGPSSRLELWGIGGGAQWPPLREAVGEALGDRLRVTGAEGGADPLGALPPRWVMAGALALWGADPARHRHRTAVAAATAGDDPTAGLDGPSRSMARASASRAGGPGVGGRVDSHPSGA